MPYSASVFRVVIASPGDVEEERQIVRQVVHDWNAAHAHTRRVVLLPVGWETNSVPLIGNRPQEIINSQLIRHADLLIAVFWTRLGSPTGKAASGTVEEIKDRISAGCPVMVYFSAVPAPPDSVDQQQYVALKEFKKWCQKRGLLGQFDTRDQFRDLLTRQLATLVNEHEHFRTPSSSESSSEGDATASPSSDRLSPEATELLVEASRDPNGRVLAAERFEVLVIQTNGREDFVYGADPLIQAIWEAALDELISHDFLKPVGKQGEVSQVTKRGYEAVELLAEKDSRSTSGLTRP